ncbi:flagellar basal body rod protein FlgF [Piscirickettsia salmonis]|uniref:flagellar basal body rod protein FlgF n=1 Tax=Piscirickettsia salmonis TaxID=1238 RepID=UPI0007C947D9|nr:Flagellar basal-body rod protein FlgF [Piscirickettsiaceae bacterium NZ-RLO1]
MDHGIYIAMSGAKQAFTKLAMNNNNLSNASTTGFREDLQQFRTQSVFGDYFPSRAYAMVERPGYRTEAGSFITTGRNLDAAIKGDGWFAVLAPDGNENYTRRGDFKLTPEGALLTGDGHPVIGDGGPIFLPPASELQIAENGRILIKAAGVQNAEFEVVGQLKLVNAPSQNMNKNNYGLFQFGENIALELDPSVVIESRVLEGSNVNPVAALVNNIEISRQYETQVKMIAALRSNAQESVRIMQI